ncbi:riboflavin synthase [uncultured Ferrovibrio sp.]|jgi:riboflavin synthase|uniref:riboflavin synthase n=1 Tax=uncultured Ferrovibrio sp. TaxID=1576913 RepID=UPI0026057DBA|nr:riboflavin synthase [uncultured Ferrovibrio sp.]
MFTGIITDIGTLISREDRGDIHLRIRTGYDTASIAIGASIACSGVCLTVVQKGADWFAVDVSAETMSRTVLADWKEGSRINLERSLKVGDELGGHIVSGHVDGVAEVTDVRREGESMRVVFRAPEGLAPFIAEKGSITVDGASLTVNHVDGATFGVNLIPHTQEVTTLGALKVGDRVNVEIDTLARYVARLQQWSKAS